MLRGTGAHHLIILDLEVYQDFTIVNSRLFANKPAKARSIRRYQNFKTVHRKSICFKHSFDLIGLCLRLHTSGFPNIHFLVIFRFPKISIIHHGKIKISSTLLRFGSVETFGNLGFPKCRDMKTIIHFKNVSIFSCIFQAVLPKKRSVKIQIW